MNDNLIHLPRYPGKKDVPSEKEKECLMVRDLIGKGYRFRKGKFDGFVFREVGVEELGVVLKKSPFNTLRRDG